MPIAPITINNSLNIDRWKNFISPQQHNAEKIDFLHEFPWVKDKSIANALTELKKLKFAPEDIMYLKSFGVNIPFKSGAEAVDFIEKRSQESDKVSLLIRTKEPLDESERGEWKSWLKAQHSEN